MSGGSSGASVSQDAGVQKVEKTPDLAKSCWSREVIQGFNVQALWEVAPGEVWAVGYQLGGKKSGGQLYRRSGRGWALAYEKEHTRLVSMWGSAANDVWIGGSDGTLLHWDGERFSSSDGGQKWPVTAIWGSGRDDVWANGPPHTLLHRRGGNWELVRFSESVPEDPREQFNIFALWGKAANDVWAVGFFGVVLHFDGATWRREETGTKEHLRALLSTGVNEVWGAGEFGTVIRRGPTGWTGVAFPPALNVYRLAGAGPEDLWASTDRGVFRYDGRGWFRVENVGDGPSGSAMVFRFGSGDIWVVQRDSILRLHSDCAAAGPSAQSVVLTPVAVERRSPDTLNEAPASESEARAFVRELLDIAKANDLARFKAKLSWKQRARTLLQTQLLAWRNVLLRVEQRLPKARFETRTSMIGFYAGPETVLVMKVTREDGELRLDEN